MGGGELIASFLDELSIDEFVITVAPVFIGDGIPLIATSPPRAPGFQGGRTLRGWCASTALLRSKDRAAGYSICHDVVGKPIGEIEVSVPGCTGLLRSSSPQEKIMCGLPRFMRVCAESTMLERKPSHNFAYETRLLLFNNREIPRCFARGDYR